MTDFDRLIDTTAPITLEGVNTRAALMDRKENKYFVPADLLAEILAGIGGLRVLQIGGSRRQEYTSTYLDTDTLLFFRQHVQGRRHRHKVRLRTYVSGESFLEVKAKGGRGQTVKERMPVPSAGHLGPDARDFIDTHLGHPGASSRLHTVLVTEYTRVTFVIGSDRVTCDLDLRFRPLGQTATAGETLGGPAEVLVETKSGSGRGAVDRELLARGIRPSSVSKYGVGISLGFEGVPTNRWNRVLRTRFDYSPDSSRLNTHSRLRRNEAGVTTAMVTS